jgi:rubredoxin
MTPTPTPVAAAELPVASLAVRLRRRITTYGYDAEKYGLFDLPLDLLSLIDEACSHAAAQSQLDALREEVARLTSDKTELSLEFAAAMQRCSLTIDRLTREKDAALKFQPIDMILHCPKCGLRHVDEPEHPNGPSAFSRVGDSVWTNPPHRSHLCHGCGHVWRPADVPTNGVEKIATCGKNDSPPVDPRDAFQQLEYYEGKLGPSLTL